jgi:hypothetical protein
MMIDEGVILHSAFIIPHSALPMTTQLGSQHDSPAAPGEEPAARYRALSAAAVVSLVFGVLSLLTLFDWLLAIVPAVGIAVGWLAQRRIRETREELTGLGLARAGMGLSLAFWVLGYGWLISARVQEVPFGYQRVTYEMLQPNRDAPGGEIPTDIYKLQDKKVFVKGYMAPGRQLTGLRQFVLCPAIPNCPFCTPNPKPTEMIHVKLTGDLEAEYTTHLVRLGGKLTVDPESRNGIPYAVEADYLR